MVAITKLVANTVKRWCSFFNWHPNGNVDLRTNIYYLQTTDFGKTWTTVEGEKISVPVMDVGSPALLKEFFSQEKNVYIKDVSFDENGNPAALYLLGSGHEPGPLKGSREWFVLHWTGKEWQNHKITESDQNYDTGSLIIQGGEWMVVGPSDNSPQLWGSGGEVVMWRSQDQGKTWKKTKQLTTNSDRNHNYVRKVHGGTDPFYFFWADGNPDKLSQSILYFGSSKGKVWELPYNMDEDYEKPKRLRRGLFQFLNR